MYLAGFSAASPSGILIGMAVPSLPHGNCHGHFPCCCQVSSAGSPALIGAFTALPAGTFMYIGANEVPPRPGFNMCMLPAGCS